MSLPAGGVHLFLDYIESGRYSPVPSALDMQISVLSHEGALEINQLSATSRLTLPEDYRFRSTKKGIATHIYYERQGKKVDDFSDADADNYIEFNGIKSELVIVEAEV